MAEELPLRPDVLQGEDVVEGVLAVGEELSEQQGVRHEDRQHHHHQVEELAEAEVEVVLGVPGPEAEEVPGDSGRLEPPGEQVLHHVVLQVFSPQAAGELCESEAEGEEEGEPQVVGGDGGVLLRGDLALVHEAAGGLALQVVPHVGSPVDPAVGPGEI